MTRTMLQDLAVVLALESRDRDEEGDADEGIRLAAIANELWARAEALKPRAVPKCKPRSAA